MPYSMNDLPDSAKNLTKPQKEKFISVANAILETGADEGLAIATAIKEAKKIKKSIKIEKVSDETDNFIYATVYEQNLWTEKSTGRKFTICKSCNKALYIDELSDGYCSDCEEPLGDVHGDLADGETIEKACWNYLKGITEKANKTTQALKVIKNIINGESEIEITDVLKILKNDKYHVGYSHSIFDKSIGYPVENHCVRETIEAFGKQYDKITWKAGFIVDDYIFEKCLNGEIVGFSFGAFGSQIPLQNGDSE